MEHSHKQVTCMRPSRHPPTYRVSLRVHVCAVHTCPLQEQELLARISDLQTEVCSRSNRIADLDHEIHCLNETIDTLTRELEIKGKEVLRVRSEANQQIRWVTQGGRNAKKDALM